MARQTTITCDICKGPCDERSLTRDSPIVIEDLKGWCITLTDSEFDRCRDCVEKSIQWWLDEYK